MVTTMSACCASFPVRSRGCRSSRSMPTSSYVGGAMESRTQDLDPEDWQTLVGTWAIDASHPMLPGDQIQGQMKFEWLDGRRLLIQRSHYDHPDIPDAAAILGVIDDQLSMHYFDSRGVHRIFTVSFSEGTLHYARNAPGFSQ